MKKEQISVQMYTIRDFLTNIKDFEASCMKLHNIGYRAVELAGFNPNINLKEIKKILVDNDIKCVSTHSDANILFNETEKIIEELNILEAEYTVYPYPAGYSFRTINIVNEFCDKLNKAGKILNENGKTLCYHNHHLEFVKAEEEIVLDLIYKNTNPKYLQGEIDTYWVQFGGQCIGSWINKLNNRLPILHMKDYGVFYNYGAFNTGFAEIGVGNIDWEKIIKKSDTAGVKWYVVEQDTCPGDPFDSLKISYDYIVNNLCED